MNQMSVNNDVFSAKTGVFLINNTTYEIGGKNKTSQQIKGINNAYLIRDDIEYGFGNTIPLWHFGLMY